MPANPDFDDIVTTTLRNRNGKLADNATRPVAFLDRLRRKGKVKPADGGRSIVQEIEAALNNNGGWYAGGDELNTNAFEGFTAAEYDYKQAAVPVVWFGMEKLKNQGEYATINLITSRVKNGEKALVDLVAQASYADGTSFGGKQLHGLGLFVVASPTTGLVGGIDRALSSFWQNQATTVAMSTPANVAVTQPTAFLQALNTIAIATSRGSDHADLYVADGVGYTRYLESLQVLQRIASDEMAGFGFKALKYNGVGGDADFVLDNGYCPAKTAFALNSDYIYLRPHPDRDFVAFGGDRVPVNQDATVRHIGFAGNICGSNLALQGTITSSN